MKTVHVAVAVIANAADEILIARRPDHLHMGGFWEFPGGKVELGETVLAALQREIQEEVGLHVSGAERLMQIPFSYPEKNVLLDVWLVREFCGTAQGCEGQSLCWVEKADLPGYTFPPANRSIVTALLLSSRVLVTGAFTDADDCLRRTRKAITRYGIECVQLRAHQLGEQAYIDLAADMALLCHEHGVRLILNTSPGVAMACTGQHAGLHLSRHHLMNTAQRPVPATQLFGASCHNAEELRHAVAMGADYVSLSPVLPTGSHAGEAGLGWEALARLAALSNVPVLALGGLRDDDLPVARSRGALGISAISAWW